MANSESIDKSLLQTFVPVNALSGDHLDRLLEQQEVVHYRAGEVLFRKGEQDNHTIYVLKGEVELDQGDGNCQLISAGGVESWHPLDHIQPRRSTATAKTDVSVVRFSSAGLDSILAWDQSAGYVILDINSNAAYQDDRHWMIRLLKSKLFYRIPPGNILEIFRRLKPLRFRAGQAVINQGDDADCCYIIKQGLCEVLIKAEGAADPTPVALLEQGQAMAAQRGLTQRRERPATSVHLGACAQQRARGLHIALPRSQQQGRVAPIVHRVHLRTLLDELAQGHHVATSHGTHELAVEIAGQTQHRVACAGHHGLVLALGGVEARAVLGCERPLLDAVAQSELLRRVNRTTQQ